MLAYYITVLKRMPPRFFIVFKMMLYFRHTYNDRNEPAKARVVGSKRLKHQKPHAFKDPKKHQNPAPANPTFWWGKGQKMGWGKGARAKAGPSSFVGKAGEEQARWQEHKTVKPAFPPKTKGPIACKVPFPSSVGALLKQGPLAPAPANPTFLWGKGARARAGGEPKKPKQGKHMKPQQPKKPKQPKEPKQGNHKNPKEPKQGKLKKLKPPSFALSGEKQAKGLALAGGKSKQPKKPSTLPPSFGGAGGEQKLPEAVLNTGKQKVSLHRKSNTAKDTFAGSKSGKQHQNINAAGFPKKAQQKRAKAHRKPMFALPLLSKKQGKRQHQNTTGEKRFAQKNGSVSKGSFLNRRFLPLPTKGGRTDGMVFSRRQIKPKQKKKRQWNKLSNKLPSRFGLVHIKKTKRNTHCSVSNLFGRQATVWSIRAGQIPGSRRKTRYSLRNVLQALVKKLLALGFDRLVLQIKGWLLARRFIYKTFCKRKSFKIILFKYNPAIAHNGCRAPKVRRL
jgi:ribosomal protein S11